MKINKKELQEALEKVKPGLANRERELIEQSTSFAFIGNKVVTYNDEISISHPIKNLNVTGAIKAQSLYSFLSKIKKDEIDIEWEDKQVIIKADKAKAGLILEQEIKLPVEEIGKIGKWHNLPEEFIEAIKFCYPCCSKDMSRPVLTCIHVNGDKIEASDSYQIIRYKLKEKATKEFLIPNTAVKELINYDIKKVSYGESWIHFKTDDGTIFSSRTINDEFPKVEGILKIENSTTFEFPVKIKEALERANVFANKSEITGDLPVVNIQVGKGQIKLNTKNEYGWFEENIKIKDKKSNFKFSIGIEFLLGMLNKLRSCEITSNKIAFNGENWNHVVAIALESEDDE